MAVLTASELTPLRQGYALDTASVNATKAQINTAVQALEDWWETTAKIDAGTEIETAVPGEFTNPEKKTIGRWWLYHKFFAGG